MAPADMEAPTTDAKQVVEKTPLCQKLCCGTGHVLNDLFLQIVYSFNLVYFIKVAKLDGSQAGLIVFISVAVNAMFAPIVGYCIDALTVPLISRALGRRKAWHLIGVLTMAMFFPLLYTRCFVCRDDSSWDKFAYYLTMMICTNIFGFSTLEVSHLSIISVVAKNQRESVELNVLRTVNTYACGILAYGVAWIMLTKDDTDDLSPSSWKDFTIINCILVAVGSIFSGVIFHIGTKEPRKPRAIDGLFTKQGLFSVAVITTMGSNVEEERGEVPKKSQNRKVSVVRKISPYLMPFDASILTNPDGISDEEHMSGEVPKKSQNRKVSVVRKISPYLMPFDASILTNPDGISDEEHMSDVALYLAAQVLYLAAQPEEIGKQREGEHNDKIEDDNNEATVHGTSGTQDATRKSSFSRKIVDACHVVENAIKIIPKTRKSWLKDPSLYRVSAIYAITRVIVGAGYSYMPFYLTDYLLLQKESIAYFPLILLVSGLCGTVCSKLLEKKLGSKWTYCLAASALIGTDVWFYFITRSTTYLTYPAAILVGATSSMMVAMSLTYMTDLVGENKETSGFVFSVGGFMTRLTAGVFYVTVQNFYPTRSEDGGECEKCAIFARYVYTLTLAALTLLNLLIVLFFQKSNSPGNAKRRSLEDADQSRPIPWAAHKDSATHPVRLTSYKNSLNSK